MEIEISLSQPYVRCHSRVVLEFLLEFSAFGNWGLDSCLVCSQPYLGMRWVECHFTGSQTGLIFVMSGKC